MSSREQRVFDFLHEQALAADFRERRVLQPVARRLDDDDPARVAARLLETRGDGVCLPQRQLAAARPQPQLGRGVSHGPSHDVVASSESMTGLDRSATAFIGVAKNGGRGSAPRGCRTLRHPRSLG